MEFDSPLGLIDKRDTMDDGLKTDNSWHLNQI